MSTDDERDVAAYQAAGHDVDKAMFAVVESTNRRSEAVASLLRRHSAGEVAEMLGLRGAPVESSGSSTGGEA